MRTVAAELASAARGFEDFANARPTVPFAGSVRVSDAIGNAVSATTSRVSVAALGARAAEDAARAGVDELDAADRALVTALG